MVAITCSKSVVNLSTSLLLIGPLAYRAAAYTAVVVGGLSLTAACAPSDKYLHMAGPLSIGLGIVCVASIGEPTILLCLPVYVYCLGYFILITFSYSYVFPCVYTFHVQTISKTCTV